MALATKALPQKDGLDQRLVIVRLHINDESKRIQLVGFIETLSPTGVVVTKSDEMIFTTENVSAIMGTDDDGTPIEKTPANPAYDNLDGSPIGQQIKGMIQDRINKLF